MNQLSWILYWADVLPSLATGLCAVSVLLALLCAVGCGVYMMARILPTPTPETEDLTSALGFTRWLFPLCLVLGLSTNLVPSKDTFYAIAVSEVGEDVLKSPEVGKARQALNNWLDKQIKQTTEQVQQQ